MRFPLALGLIFLAINLAVDFYIYRRLRAHRLLRAVHLVLCAALSLLWLGVVCMPKRIGDDAFMLRLMWAIYAYVSVYIAKYISAAVDAVSALPLLWRRKRIRPLSYAGYVLGAATFCVLWWGALVERLRLDVHTESISIPGLPQSFKGMRIVQISDWHVGSYGSDTTFVSRTVDSINALHPDLIVFTGDIVNRHSTELQPFTGPLSRLRAPFGVYSVMGNHDYGDYYSWPSEKAHISDADSLRKMQRAMGWNMLDNRTEILHIGNDSIALIGVENIGEPPFATRGTLRKAYPDVSDSTVKILLSHNPRHWTDSIASCDSSNIALTLSGHTHAMQMEIAGYSPAKYRYPTWGGLYHDGSGQYLYVNRGLGTVGVPTRIGATPEITLITLE